MNTFNVFLGNPSTFPEKYHNKYDVIACAGLIVAGHCGPEVFDEMLLALKTGGLAVFSTRAAFVKSNCQERMDELVETGKWEFIGKEEFTRYDILSESVEGFTTTPAIWSV